MDPVEFGLPMGTLRDDFLDFIDFTDGTLQVGPEPPTGLPFGHPPPAPPTPLFQQPPPPLLHEQPYEGQPGMEPLPPFPQQVPPPPPQMPQQPPAPMTRQPFFPPGLPHDYAPDPSKPPPPSLQGPAFRQFQSTAETMQQPADSFNQLFQANFPFQTSPPRHITLVEGFINPVKPKMPGGTDNIRSALPPQVVELNLSAVPPGTDPTRLSCRCLLLGWDRAAKERRVLTELSLRRFVRLPQAPRPTFVVVFDDLVVKFSSAYNGIRGRLYLQFVLLDSQHSVIDSIESQGFQTITRRGLEKQRERARRRQAKIMSRQFVHSVLPPVGLTNGSLLVRIRGEGFLASPLMGPSSVIVTFGDTPSREIVSIRRDVIVCETPPHEPGLVNVNVSLDGGQNFILNSQGKFLYVSPKDQNGLQMMMNCLMNPHQPLNFGGPGPGMGPGMGGGPPPSSSSSNGYSPSSPGSGGYYSNSNSYSFETQNEFMNFVVGVITDSNGFSILHHAAARGYFELLAILFGVYDLKKNLNVNQTDHFGRTSLMWSILSSSSLLVSALLIAAGARMELQDVYGNSIFHLIVSEKDECDVELLKQVLFYYLKFDDEYRSRTRTIQRMLTMSNNEGLTPEQLLESRLVGSEHEDEEEDDDIGDFMLLKQLFRDLSSFCDSRLRTFEASSIQIRSGPQNGIIISSLSSFGFLDSSDQMEIRLDRTTKILIPNNDLAFVILAKLEERIEFTLHRPPSIFLFEEESEEWELTPEPSSHPLHCLSFHLYTSLSELRRLKRLFTTSEYASKVHEFKPWSFLIKSPRMVMKKRRRKRFVSQGRKHTHVLERKLRTFKQENLDLLVQARQEKLRRSRVMAMGNSDIPDSFPSSMLELSNL